MGLHIQSSSVLTQTIKPLAPVPALYVSAGSTSPGIPVFKVMNEISGPADIFSVAPNGIVTIGGILPRFVMGLIAGVPDNADTAPNGSIVIDTTAGALYYKAGGVYKKSMLPADMILSSPTTTQVIKPTTAVTALHVSAGTNTAGTPVFKVINELAGPLDLLKVSPNGILQVDGVLPRVATGVMSTVPDNSDVAPNGSLVVESTAGALYFKTSGAYKKIPLATELIATTLKGVSNPLGNIDLEAVNDSIVIAGDDANNKVTFTMSRATTSPTHDPAPVGAAAAIGTLAQLARADHVHRGVSSLTTTAVGATAIYGAVTLSDGLGTKVSQTGSSATMTTSNEMYSFSLMVNVPGSSSVDVMDFVVPNSKILYLRGIGSVLSPASTKVVKVRNVTDSTDIASTDLVSSLVNNVSVVATKQVKLILTNTDTVAADIAVVLHYEFRAV